jgi:hypothetical protein
MPKIMSHITFRTDDVAHITKRSDTHINKSSIKFQLFIELYLQVEAILTAVWSHDVDVSMSPVHRAFLVLLLAALPSFRLFVSAREENIEFSF